MVAARWKPRRRIHHESQKRHWRSVCFWGTRFESAPELRKEIMRGMREEECKWVGGVSKKFQLDGMPRFHVWVRPEHMNHLILGWRNRGRMREWTIREDRMDRRRRNEGKKAGRAKPHILTWNVNGMKQKYESVVRYIYEKAPLIVLLQETKRKSQRMSLKCERYHTIEHLAANGNHAHGVALLYRSDAGISVEEIDCGEWSHCMIAVEVRGLRRRVNGTWSNLRLVVICFYKAHLLEAGTASMYAKLKQIRQLFPEHEVIVGGDFNEEPKDVDKRLTNVSAPGRAPMERCGPIGIEYRTRHKFDLRPSSHIDHFARTEGIEEPQIVVDQKNDESDHFPVFAKWKGRNGIAIERRNKNMPERMIPRRCRDQVTKIKGHNMWEELNVRFPGQDEDMDADQLDEFVAQWNETAWKVARELKCTTKCRNEETKGAKRAPLPKSAVEAIRKCRKARKRYVRDNCPRNKRKWKKQRNKKRRELRKAAKERRENFKQMVAEMVQEDDMSSAWKLFKILTSKGGRVQRERLIDPETGVPVDSDEREAELWIQHFEELASDTCESRNRAYWLDKVIEWHEHELPGIDRELSWPEMFDVIRRLGRRKSPGQDGIISEFLLPVTESWNEDEEQPNDEPNCAMGKVLFRLLSKVWNMGYMPKAWENAVVVPIPKKGDLSQRDNYRGISLMSVVQKILSTVIADRVQRGLVATNRIRREQSGFINREEAVAQAACLVEVLERRKKEGKETWLCFIDFAKAYDSVPHEALFKKMEAIGVRGKILELVKNMYERAKMCCRRADGGMSEPAPFRKGVRQGDPCSPILFNIFINDMMSEDVLRDGVWLDPKMPDNQTQLLGRSDKKVGALAYADDVVLIAPTREALARMMSKVSDWSDKWKMKVNAAKCGVMKVRGGDANQNLPPRDPPPMMQGQEVPLVEEYVYLGSHLTSTVDLDAMAEARRENGERARLALNPFLAAPRVPLLAKINMIRGVIIPKATFGIELWGTDAERTRKLQTKISDSMRKALGTSQKVPSVAMMRELRTNSIEMMGTFLPIRLYVKARSMRGRIADCVAPLDRPPVMGGWAGRCWKWLMKNGLQEPIARLERLEGHKPEALVYDSVELVKGRVRATEEIRERERAGRSARYLDGPQSLSRVLHRMLWEYIEYSYGITLLMRYRIGALWTASDFANWPEGKPLFDKKWKRYCPFCQRRTPDNDRHAIIACRKWNTEREQSFAWTSEEVDRNGEKVIVINSGRSWQALEAIFGKKAKYWKKSLKGIVPRMRRATVPHEALSIESRKAMLLQVIKFLDRTGFERRSVHERLRAVEIEIVEEP